VVPTALYDANVLYPAPLRDLLVRIAVAGAVRARWTVDIHEEWTRNLLLRRSDLTRAQLERTCELMNRAVPDCLVTGHRSLIRDLVLPDPDDRHVLAAAIRARADVIVTSNRRDFPDHALAPHHIRAVGPDTFITDLLDQVPGLVHVAVREHRRALRRPPYTPEEYLESLERVGLTKAALRLRSGCPDL
jgi:hypothetical protein